MPGVPNGRSREPLQEARACDVGVGCGRGHAQHPGSDEVRPTRHVPEVEDHPVGRQPTQGARDRADGRRAQAFRELNVVLEDEDRALLVGQGVDSHGAMRFPDARRLSWSDASEGGRRPRDGRGPGDGTGPRRSPPGPRGSAGRCSRCRRGTTSRTPAGRERHRPCNSGSLRRADRDERAGPIRRSRSGARPDDAASDGHPGGRRSGCAPLPQRRLKQSHWPGHSVIHCSNSAFRRRVSSRAASCRGRCSSPTGLKGS